MASTGSLLCASGWTASGGSRNEHAAHGRVDDSGVRGCPKVRGQILVMGAPTAEAMDAGRA